MKLQLLVMRHGEAENTITTDFDRVLTENGREEVSATCRIIAGETRGKSTPVRILASPLPRAQETAKIARSLLSVDTEILTCEWLVPDCRPRMVVMELEKAVGTQTNVLMLVSHQPLVSALVDYLTGEKVGMDTATAAMIRCDILASHCGELEWVQKG